MKKIIHKRKLFAATTLQKTVNFTYLPDLLGLQKYMLEIFICIKTADFK